MTDMLSECGFSIGDTVERKKDKIHGLIESISGSEVTLAVDESVFPGGQCNVHGKSFLQSEWRTIKQKSDPEEITDQGSPLEHPEVIKMINKGKLISELISLAQKNDHVNHLQLYNKPKMVCARRAFKPGKLILPPVTFKIETCPDGTSNKTNGILVQEGGMNYFLMPCTILPKSDGQNQSPHFVVPYWLVRGTEKEEEANVEAFGPYSCFRNHKQIKDGEELRVYVPKTVREPEPLQAPKRRRLTGKTS